MSADPVYRLLLLGDFQLADGARTVRFARRKCASLLAYLVLHPGPQARDSVAQALWHESAADAARGSLRVTLTELRKVLGDAVLDVGEGGTLALRPAAFAGGIDVLELRAALAHGDAAAPADWQAALAQYRGDLLTHLDEPWVAGPRERLRGELRRLLHRLVAHHRSAAEYARAIALARRALQLDDTDEVAHQHLMACLWAHGEREAALHQYSLCEQALAQHLGQAPSAETLALVQGLRRQAARAGSARLSNLPQPATSFIGREDELSDIEDRLTRTRLLTLFGPGGSGKTRLALQAAAEVAYGFEGGVWWVDLSTLEDGQRVLKALADVLGVKEQGDAALLTLVLRHVGAQVMLIVLDNCEQVLDACVRMVESLLGGCPGLKVLATSRQALQLPAEVVWETPTLALPDGLPNPVHEAALFDATAPAAADLLSNDAVRLFGERAHQADGAFQLGAHNAAQVLSICRRLQGIPLAIELAAAQLCAVSLAQLEQRLDDALDFAAQGQPVGRHATLRSAIRWSCRGLGAAEQALFRRLSVFAGGFTLNAAAEVATGTANAQAAWCPAGGRLAPDALAPLPLDSLTLTSHLLDSLVRKALVQVRHGAHGPRWVMLDTLREDARRQCEAAGEMPAVQQAHYAHGLALAQHLEPLLGGPEQQRQFDILERESANLEAALDWAEQGPSPGPALTLAVALSPWWKQRSHLARAFQRLQPLLQRAQDAAAPSPAEQALYAQAWCWLSDVAGRINRLPVSIAAAKRSQQIFESLGDRPGQARAAAALSLAAAISDDLKTARQAGLHSLQLCRELNDTPGLTIAINRLAELTRVQGLYAESVQYNRESMALAQQAGDVRIEYVALLNLGLLAVAQGRPAEGAAALLQAGQSLRDMGLLHHSPYIFQGVGQACCDLGRPADAARLFGALQAYSTATGFELLGSDRQAHQQALAVLLGPDAPASVQAGWQAGVALDADAALRLLYRSDVASVERAPESTSPGDAPGTAL